MLTSVCWHQRNVTSWPSVAEFAMFAAGYAVWGSVAAVEPFSGFASHVLVENSPQACIVVGADAIENGC